METSKSIWGYTQERSHTYATSVNGDSQPRLRYKPTLANTATYFLVSQLFSTCSSNCTLKDTLVTDRGSASSAPRHFCTKTRGSATFGVTREKNRTRVISATVDSPSSGLCASTFEFTQGKSHMSAKSATKPSQTAPTSTSTKRCDCNSKVLLEPVKLNTLNLSRSTVVWRLRTWRRTKVVSCYSWSERRTKTAPSLSFT